jgi:tetratricopeptide (TPR) repeat protein
MEQLFQQRLPEFYETLAYHFKQGRSIDRAVDYLIKSGEKSLSRYAVEESHQYYREAFELLSHKPKKSQGEKELLIDLLIKWGLVYYYRGNFRELTELLIAHEELARSLDDKARLGMLLAWLGFAWFCRGKVGDSYDYLSSALKIGEEMNDQKLIGYSCAWLTWTCFSAGLLKQAIAFGEKAQAISSLLKSDNYLHFKSLAGLALAYLIMGEPKKASEAGKVLLDYGMKHSNIRSLVMGHDCIGFAYGASGELTKAIECFREAVQISQDPFYSLFSKWYYGMYNFTSGNLKEAEEALTEVLKLSQEFGAEFFKTGAQPYLGAILLAKGQMSPGMKMLEEARETSLQNQNRLNYFYTEYILGKVYSLIAMGGEDRLASKKAEDHFNEAISVAKEAGMRPHMGRAYLDLGLLYRKTEKTEQAKKCLSEAIQIFEQTEAEGYLKQAKEALASLGGK